MQILNSSELKEWDAYTMLNEPISSIDLMERAASRCATAIIDDYGKKSIYHVVANKGNNGGDGLVIARIFKELNIKVRVSVLDFSPGESPEFTTNLNRLPRSIIEHIDTAENLGIKNEEVIIDAVFGYGLSRPTEGEYGRAIELINKKKIKVVSIDMPSGLFADRNNENTGQIICAKTTYTFECMKTSLLLSGYSKYYGEVKIIAIGLDKRYLSTIDVKSEYLNKEALPELIKREKFSHKGLYGHAHLIGGGEQMRGAAILSAKAAMRSGVGKLSVSLPPSYIKNLNIELPEAMCHTEKNQTDYSALAIGPGLGADKEARQKLQMALRGRKTSPLVLDADALNIISNDPGLLDYCVGSVMTPHIGEFKRLCGEFSSDEEKQEKQIAFSVKNKLTMILKGAHTTISTPEGKLFFNSTGNPGMATAGSGDVLTGILLSLLAQGYSETEASCLGVYIHGQAGDLALEKQSTESLIASDIIENIGRAIVLIRN